MRISDWSSDVCSSDLYAGRTGGFQDLFALNKPADRAAFQGQVTWVSRVRISTASRVSAPLSLNLSTASLPPIRPASRRNGRVGLTAWQAAFQDPTGSGRTGRLWRPTARRRVLSPRRTSAHTIRASQHTEHHK